MKRTSFLLGVIISALVFQFSAKAEEPNVAECLSMRMFELALVEFDDISPIIDKSFFGVRLYAKKEGKIFLIAGSFDEKKNGIIEASELLRRVYPRKDLQEWLKRELKEGEFFDFRSMMIAKHLFTERGISQEGKVKFERQ